MNVTWSEKCITCQAIEWALGMCYFTGCSTQTDEVSTFILSGFGKTGAHRTSNLPEVTWVVRVQVRTHVIFIYYTALLPMPQVSTIRSQTFYIGPKVFSGQRLRLSKLSLFQKAENSL